MTKKLEAGSLDALAYAALPDHELVPRLAAYKLRQGKSFDLEDSRILLRTIFGKGVHGDLERLANLVYEEYQRQKPVFKARAANQVLAEQRNRTIAQRLSTKSLRERRRIELAMAQFGDYVESSFSDDVLALLELMKHEHRLYQVEWLDAGVKPAIYALLHVTVTGEKSAHDENFLIYKVPGTSKIKAAEVPSSVTDGRGAWAYQVPKEIVQLRQMGWSFRTDFDAQTLVATGPSGDLVFPWQGSASHGDAEGVQGG